MAGSVGGAFTGLYQGQSGAQDAAAALKPLLPNISVYQNGSSTAPSLQNQITTPSQTYSAGGNLAKFGHFLGGLASETGHLVEGATSWLAHNAVNAVEAPGKLGVGIGHGILDRLTLDDIQKQNQQISGRLQTLHTQFKAGKINAKQYTLGLKLIGSDSKNLDQESSAMVNKVTLDQKATTKALVDTSTDLVMVLSMGTVNGVSLGIKVGSEGVGLEPVAARSAADFLASKVAAPMLEPVSATISRLAVDSKAFQLLDSATQNVLQRSTAEVMAQAGPNLTAGQIARATAVNVALKYPIQFNYMSSTANQVYQELDQKKYGDAIRTVAFNGALILSGGPIGQALKYGGSALKDLSEKTFGQTSFWDELSKFYGTQETDGFTKAISKMAQAIESPTDRAEFIKNLAAVEATNVAAMGGDAVAGAARLARGEQAKSISALTTLTHEQAITDMVNFAKNLRLADETAKAKGLENIVIGRFDVRSKGVIADAITQGSDVQSRLQAWEDLKAANPNDALANNASLDRQVRDAIAKYDNPTELRQYIGNIKASSTVPGFPQEVLDKMAQDGYIPIQPKNLRAPFKEGTGKLLTATPTGEDFFTKAVQPLPVLGSVGALFTRMGLSPNASTQRVYQMFTDNVARNLGNTSAAIKIEKQLAEQRATIEAEKAARAAQKSVKAVEAGPAEGPVKVEGETPKPQITATDYMLKKLSSYAHNLKVPVQDMRMLTNKHIREALKDMDIGFGDAEEIQHSISKAQLQVPLAVKGLGDRAVDWTYGLPGSDSIARRYIRIQGALRFSFNPFFQYMRVIPKTEILTEAEGGGFLSSIFMGRANQISDIRQAMRKGGLLEEVGHLGNVTGGEAVDIGSRNLSKKLLPMQERSIAGLIDSQAQRMGMDWKDYIAQFPHETADTVQAIAGYSRNSNFLNSPLARTLNIAIFPFRFDAKVATILAQGLARTGTITQVAFINGLMHAHEFLQSPQGQAWYSQNSEAIGLFKYITPVASLSEAFQSLLPGHDHSLGNFGELGGLPFGWIPQILDSEGLTNFNQTGIDAKTGNAFPQYVPKTTKGQAAIAVQDLLGMLFSYPGAEIGLPSKGKMTSGLAQGIVGGHSSDFTKTTPALTPAQQQYQQNVSQGDGRTPPAPPNYQAQPSGNTFVTPTSEPPDLASQLRANAKAKKLKKGDFIPPPAPGQKALGVL